MKVAMAQIAPVLLDRDATLAKVVEYVDKAAAQECGLVCFGETLVPGYPVWLSRANGSKFNDTEQKRLHALYLEQAVDVDQHLQEVCAAAKKGGIAVVLGVAEKPMNRGGHTLYASAVYISAEGEVTNVHRKLMPTFEERLAWGPGDGHGLRVQPLGEFRVGMLNCWENWLPMPRASLYAQGETLHVAIWPGAVEITKDITRFVAREGRVFVVSAGSILRDCDIPQHIPLRDKIVHRKGELLQDGGSCVASPTGEWVLEPTASEEEMLLVAEVDAETVRMERQNLDVSGHYSRPDVLSLHVDRRRQAVCSFTD